MASVSPTPPASPAPSTLSAWIEGARLRTLPAAAAPVMVGTAAAFYMGTWAPLRAALALTVALALQIGANYSNDYSDGIRGTDDHRVGPPRLTGGGLVAPHVVRTVAFLFFALAGIAGFALVCLSHQWWMIAAGLGAVLAAWFYTGGRRPYGYAGVGLSELMVFLFFGLMACVGTTWTQVHEAPWWLWVAASALGLLSVAMLMINNIRDIDTDTAAGKRTLAVRVGRRAARLLFSCALLTGGPALALVLLACNTPALYALSLAAAWEIAAASQVHATLRAHTGPAHVAVLRRTGQLMILWAFIVCLLLCVPLLWQG